MMRTSYEKGYIEEILLSFSLVFPNVISKYLKYS